MKEKSCGAIVIYQGKVLLIESKEGIIGFPKGHVEYSETEEKTAIREVKEETNIDIVITSTKKYIFSYLVKGIIPKDVIYFLAKPISYDLTPQIQEINKVFWVDIDEVYNTLNYEDVKEFWQKVKKDIIC